jgi:hypothetical protein
MLEVNAGPSFDPSTASGQAELRMTIGGQDDNAAQDDNRRSGWLVCIQQLVEFFGCEDVASLAVLAGRFGEIALAR